MPNLQSLLNPIFEHAAFRGALQTLTAVEPGARAPATVSGLTSSAKTLLVAGLAHRLARPVVVLTADNETAANLQRTTSTFLAWLEPLGSPTVLTLPALDCSPYEGRSPHAEILEQRAVTLWSVAQGRARVLYVPIAAALGRFQARALYSSLALEFKIGDELTLEDLAEHLSGVGYEREEPVSDVGQFSTRGGIVDIFPPEAARPFRIEFLGDQIESLREFDPATQRSRRPVPAALLLPLSETKRSRQFFEKLVRALEKRVVAGGAAGAQTGAGIEREPEWANEYANPFPGWEVFAPLAEPHPISLFALFNNPVVLWDEPLDRTAQLKSFLEGWAAGFDEVRDVIPPRPRPEDILFTEQEFLQSVGAIPQLNLKELSLSGGVESRESRSPEFVLLTQPSPKFQAGLKGLVENLRGNLERGMSVVLVTPTGGKAERLRGILAEYEIPFDTATQEGTAAEPSQSGAGTKPAPTGVALMARGDLAEGFVIPDLEQMWLADSDLFGGFDWAPRRREHSGVSSFISGLGRSQGGRLRGAC